MTEYTRRRATLKNPRFKKRTLGNAFQMVITLCRLKTYNPLSRNFNNITRWLNLTNVNLSNNKIGELPNELGTLPYLQWLNLSQNCLGQYRWQWLKQAAIRDTLFSLDISNNLLPELSENIWKLNALVELNISHNLLRRLPQDIKNVKNLKILDVSHNFLICLPVEICRLNLEVLDISMNSFENASKTIRMIPRLTQFASQVLQHRSSAHIKYPSISIMEYVNRNTRESCIFCGKIFRRAPYEYTTIQLSVHKLAHVKVISDEPKHLYSDIIYLLLWDLTLTIKEFISSSVIKGLTFTKT